MQEIVDLIRSYGVDVVVLALSINVLTGIFKIPIKRLSARLEPKGVNVKKYITLLPIVLGFALASLATGLIFEKGVFWNERTPVLALTASSISLSLYAICEKLFARAAAPTQPAAENIGKDDKTEQGASVPANEETNDTDEKVETQLPTSIDFRGGVARCVTETLDAPTVEPAVKNVTEATVAPLKIILTRKAEENENEDNA